MNQQPDQDWIVMATSKRSISTIASHTRGSDATLSSASESAPKTCEETACAANTVEPVNFVDVYRRKFSLPVEECRSARSTRELIAKEFNLEGYPFDFWIEDRLISGTMWTREVKPGTVINLHPSPPSLPAPPAPPAQPSLLAPPAQLSLFAPSAPPASPASPAPPAPPPQPPPPSVPCLRFSEVWTAEGPYRLSLPGCEHRVFTFFGRSHDTNLSALNLYLNLRKRAPPERWSDLHGNVVTSGHPTAPVRPQVNIGPVLADHHLDLRGYIYVLIQKAELSKYVSYRDNDRSPHLDGDSVYRWIPYPSREHAEAGLEESFYSGYSTAGNWAERDVSRVSTAQLEQFTGEQFGYEGCEIFAVVGSKMRAE